MVTGGSRGIGEAVARALSAKGAHVALVARNVALLDQVAASIGNGAVAVPADLADPAQVAGLVERCEVALGGPLDVLVNNAGIDEIGRLVDADAADVARIHQVNLLTPIELCRQAMPGMVARQKGHIVNVSSLAGAAGFPGMSLYCSTKAGLSGFTGILRLELRTTPVGVTLVELGPIPTDMLSRVNQCPPVERSFERLRRTQLLPQVPREKVAADVVAAIEHNRRSVVHPKRAMAFAVARAFSQRTVDQLIRGIN